MDAAKAESLENPETEFGEAGTPTAPASPRPRWRSRLLAGLVAAGLAASVLGVSLVQNPSPAAAASNCLQPDFVQRLHWKTCSATAQVQHRYVYEDWPYTSDHIWHCYYFYSTYETPTYDTDYDSKRCRLIY